MKRMVALMLLCLGLVPLLCGCLSREERARLEEFEQTAETYYEEKYGTQITIETCDYHYDNDLFSTRTDHMYAKCSDGTVIFYDADRDIIVDDKQSEAIGDALLKTVQADLDALAEEMDDGSVIIEGYRLSGIFGDFEGNFYHTYYDGDIEAFIEEEDLDMSVDVFLLCEKEDRWQETVAGVESLFRNKYDTDSSCDLTVGDESCYSGEGLRNIGYGGCYAEFQILPDETWSYVQNYIKLAEGIYVTAYEDGFVLEEGDIMLVETELTEADVDEMILAYYDVLPESSDKGGQADKESKDYYDISTSTPIYQLRFSDRLKEACPNGVDVYLRFVPWERCADPSDEILGFELDGTAFYQCSQLSDAEVYACMVSNVHEGGYYFVGSQSVVGEVEEESDDHGGVEL